MTTYLMPYTKFERLDDVLEGLLERTDDKTRLIIIRVSTDDVADDEKLYTELRGLQARIEPYNCRIEIDHRPAIAA